MMITETKRKIAIRAQNKKVGRSAIDLLPQLATTNPFVHDNERLDN
jgi:hypothetical protein